MAHAIVDLTVPHSSPSEDSSSALRIAIDQAQPDRLRDTLKRLCTGSKDTAREAQDLLLVPLDRPKPETTQAAKEEDDDTDQSGSDTSSKNEAAAAEASWTTVHGLKRQRPKYATCKNCDEEFDITQNESGDCVYHPGESEVDWDGGFWDDHDENHGTIDTEDMREQYPEGFIYDCCDENGDSEGCKTTRHIEKIPYATKRTRY